MSRQGDLFPPEPKDEPPRCGNCVTLNGVHGQDFGHCARKGLRRKADKPCEAWFGLDELLKPPYGGRRTTRVRPRR